MPTTPTSVHGMSDLLYIAGCVAFFAVMIAFALLYDRSMRNGYEGPHEVATTADGTRARSGRRLRRA